MWESKLLSLGGRLTLLNSILTVISTYWMSIFKLPRWVATYIEKIKRDFLWSSFEPQHPKIRLVNWLMLCRSREQGGWNVLNLEAFNDALLDKWWWKMVSGCLWCGVDIFRENYFKRAPLWNLFQKQCSRRLFLWSGILQILPGFRKNLITSVRGGASTLFWLDNWMEGRTPVDIWPYLFYSF